MSKNRSCKGCGKPIVWIGKIPCEPDPVPFWSGKKERIVTPNGEVLSCVLSGETQKALGVGFVPHWGNCPQAERFRKKKPGAGAAPRPGAEEPPLFV